jgi:hypothetical protein
MADNGVRVYVVTARSDQSGDMVLLRAYATEKQARDFVRAAEHNDYTDDGSMELLSHAEMLGLRLRVVALRVEGGPTKG